jgi:transcriptional regulator with XRE-family HTH domain
MKNLIITKTVIETDSKATGGNIRLLRKQLGLSQDALAKRVGITPAHMCNLEAGNRAFSPKLLQKIAAAMKKTS